MNPPDGQQNQGQPDRPCTAYLTTAPFIRPPGFQRPPFQPVNPASRPENSLKQMPVNPQRPIANPAENGTFRPFQRPFNPQQGGSVPSQMNRPAFGTPINSPKPMGIQRSPIVQNTSGVNSADRAGIPQRGPLPAGNAYQPAPAVQPAIRANPVVAPPLADAIPPASQFTPAIPPQSSQQGLPSGMPLQVPQPTSFARPPLPFNQPGLPPTSLNQMPPQPSTAQFPTQINGAQPPLDQQFSSMSVGGKSTRAKRVYSTGFTSPSSDQPPQPYVNNQVPNQFQPAQANNMPGVNGNLAQPFPQPSINQPNQQFGSGPTQQQYPQQPGQPYPQPSQPYPQQPGQQYPQQPGHQYPQQPGQPYPQAGQQPLAAPGSQKPRIDPDQIPSPVKVREQDQEVYETTPFGTSSRDVPPLATTHFKAVDEGNCNPRFMRSSLYNVPITEDLLKASHIPFGLVIQPLADLAPEEAPIPVVEFGKDGPIRCSRCKAYINPFFSFLNGGRIFVCNLCQFSNEVPAEYFSNLDMNGRRIDIHQRPELLYGSCEFAVANEYCARPPVPVSYLFAIDVSWNSIQSGMLSVFASALKFYLYSGRFQLPKGAKIGILTFDKSLHFYNLNPSFDTFQMMVVGDLEDVFNPLSEGLFVDPFAAKAQVENLLNSLPQLFSQNRVTESAVGSAAKVGFESLKNFGGKLSIFQTILPNAGLGVLKNRDDTKLIGTDKEKALYEPQEYFWKKLGQDCAVNGVNIDLYLFPTAYIDIATIGCVSALSGGEMHLYNNFDANKHGAKFANDFQRTLARTFGFDALLRVRVSNGLKIDDYLGNFYMKNSTDIELAGIDSLKSFGVTLKHDGKLTEKQEVYAQAALLYTTADGQRRVRVHNFALACSSNLLNVFRHASMETTNCLLVRQMIQQSMVTPLSTIRSMLSTKCIKLLVAYRTNSSTSSSPGQLILPESFKLFPLSCLTILKSRAFRSGNDCFKLGRIPSSDVRVYSMRLLNGLGVAELSTYLYPSIYDCTTPDESVGTMVDSRMKIFPIIRCSAMRMLPEGLYLAENGRHLFIFIGKETPSSIIKNIFGFDNPSSIQLVNELPALENPHSVQVRAVIRYLRTQRPRFMQMSIVRQGLDPQNESRFSHLLIEDPNFDNPSYIDYLISIHRCVLINPRNIQSELSNMK